MFDEYIQKQKLLQILDCTNIIFCSELDYHKFKTFCMHIQI
jgi:hypothetical protein